MLLNKISQTEQEKTFGRRYIYGKKMASFFMTTTIIIMVMIVTIMKMEIMIINMIMISWKERMWFAGF